MKGICKTLVLVWALVPQVYGAQTIYPVTSVIANIRVFTDPLTDPSDCNTGGGLIPKSVCQIQKLGATGVGEFLGTESTDTGILLDYIKLIVSLSDDPFYSYKVEAFFDDTTKDGTSLVKYMNYWIGEEGALGKIEIYPNIPNRLGPLNNHAFLVTWDSRDPLLQQLDVIMHSRTDNNNGWGNRTFAMKISALINSVDQTAEMAASTNVLLGPGLANAYQFNMKRTSTMTLVQGAAYDGTDPTILNWSGAAQCVDNGSLEVIAAATCSASSLTNNYVLVTQSPDETLLSLFGRPGFLD